MKRLIGISLWTLFLALLAVSAALSPARAETENDGKPKIAVIRFDVLPIANLANLPAGLGDRAAQFVLQEMRRLSPSARYEPLPPFRRPGADAGVKADFPLNDSQQCRLGRGLGATFVLTGTVTCVSVGGSPRRARVTITVQVLSVDIREWVNGAYTDGYSRPASATTSDEMLIDQALSDAAYNAVKTINAYTPPTATILTMRGDREVSLSCGKRGGMTLDQDMIVVRGTRRIGKVRITHVDATESTAEITDSGRGIRLGDRAITIFKNPIWSLRAIGGIRPAPAMRN